MLSLGYRKTLCTFLIPQQIVYIYYMKPMGETIIFEAMHMQSNLHSNGKCKFPPFRKSWRVGKITDRRTNQQTDMKVRRKVTLQMCNYWRDACCKCDNSKSRFDAELHRPGHLPLQHGDEALLRHWQYYVRLPFQHCKVQKFPKNGDY